jgi:hypothetical protein
VSLGYGGEIPAMTVLLALGLASVVASAAAVVLGFFLAKRPR